MEQNLVTGLRQNGSTLRRAGRQEFAIVSGDEVVGVVELFNYDAADARAETGIFVEASLRGKGIGKSAMAQLLDHCRDTLSLHQVVCDVAVDNTASLHLFESLGFTRCGLLREWTATPHGWTDAIRLQKLLTSNN